MFKLRPDNLLINEEEEDDDGDGETDIDSMLLTYWASEI